MDIKMSFDEFCQKYNITLTSAQKQAASTADGAVLLLATPGSGKTTVLVSRLGYMINALGINPEEILTMTYTVAAARDMSERYRQLFGDDAAMPEFRTINSVSCKINSYFEYAKGRTAPVLLNNSGRRSVMIGEIYRRVTGEFAVESVIRTIETAITYTKNMMLNDEEINALKPEDIDFAPIYKMYCEQLKQHRMMDYDDQMVYALKILSGFPDILEHFRRRYRYICVDEAQDTSRIQHEIIKLLAGKNGNIFMVGDEDQSIYGFRAAYPQALIDFSKTYSNARVLLIEQNFRSSKQIVDMAQSFISKNKNRYEKHMTSVRGEGAQVCEIRVKDRRAQYRYLLSAAKSCEESTAVLYRENDSAIPLIDCLVRNNIGYRCRQVDSTFFSHRVIRDITDYIHFAENPHDGEIFMRLYYKLGARITWLAAEKAVRMSRETKKTILECAAELSDDLSARTRSMCRALNTHFSHLSGDTAQKAMYRITEYMGYSEYAEKNSSGKNKIHILSLLAAEEPSAARLLERLSELYEIIRNGSTDENSQFCLSTIHSSKGLEYDNVFLADITDGILPNVVPDSKESSPDEFNAFEEERRIFYVGMTRARNRLSIFTFRDEELTSAFADSLFPKKAPKSKEKSEADNMRKLKQVFIRQKKPAAVPQETASQYTTNTAVVHKVFGRGKITAVNGDVITVVFDSGEQKRLSLSASLAKNILSPGK